MDKEERIQKEFKKPGIGKEFKDEGIGEEYKDPNFKKEPKISKETAWMMITVAIFFDLISFLINLIPIVGQVISIAIPIVAYPTFFLWFMLKGVKLMTTKRIAAMGGGFVVEVIPLVNMLPGVTASVVFTILSTKVKEVEKKIKDR